MEKICHVQLKQNVMIIHTLRAARRNKNRSHCEQHTYMDILISKTQGTISRKFPGGTPQHFEIIIVRRQTPFKKN